MSDEMEVEAEAGAVVESQRRPSFALVPVWSRNMVAWAHIGNRTKKWHTVILGTYKNIPKPLSPGKEWVRFLDTRREILEIPTADLKTWDAGLVSTRAPTQTSAATDIALRVQAGFVTAALYTESGLCLDMGRVVFQ